MTASILTTNQQKNSLSAKKFTKKNIRNVFASPFKTYWPVISGTDEAEVSKLLEELLPPGKQLQVSVDWSILCKLSQKERREIRRNLLKEAEDKDPETVMKKKELRKNLLLGVNAVTRALENDAVCCIMLAGDVDPRILVSHVITLTIIHEVPLVVVPSLRRLTLQNLGFSCIVFGIKKEVASSESHHFYSLYKKISSLSSKFQKPQNLNKLFSEDVGEEKQEEEKIAKMSNLVETSVGRHPADIYLRRKSKKERTFVPQADEKPSVTGEDFIALVDDETMENTPLTSKVLPLGETAASENEMETITGSQLNMDTSSDEDSSQRKVQIYEIDRMENKLNGINYFPLTVKKIQPNPNKVKRKKIKKIVKK